MHIAEAYLNTMIGNHNNMQINVVDFVKGAQEAEGITVIIDVFRAFTVACYCLEQKPKAINPVGSIEEALLLKKQDPSAILIGEREGKKLPGFDFGNSPTELTQGNVFNQRIIHTTHAGTQGLVNTVKATQVLTGSLVNAKATADYIVSQNPKLVTLVRMGWKAETNTDEDDFCAEYLKHLLEGKLYDISAMKQRIMGSPCVERFLDPTQTCSPKSDLDLCLAVNRFDFAVEAKKDNTGLLYLEAL